MAIIFHILWARRRGRKRNQKTHNIMSCSARPDRYVEWLFVCGLKCDPGETVQADWISAEICIQFAPARVKSIHETQRKMTAAKQF